MNPASDSAPSGRGEGRVHATSCGNFSLQNKGPSKQILHKQDFSLEIESLGAIVASNSTFNQFPDGNQTRFVDFNL